MFNKFCLLKDASAELEEKTWQTLSAAGRMRAARDSSLLRTALACSSRRRPRSNKFTHRRTSRPLTPATLHVLPPRHSSYTRTRTTLYYATSFATLPRSIIIVKRIGAVQVSRHTLLFADGQRRSRNYLRPLSVRLNGWPLLTEVRTVRNLHIADSSTSHYSKASCHGFCLPCKRSHLL